MGNGGSVPKPFGPDAAMVLKKEVLRIRRVPETEQAVFAAGCFWGVQLAFQRVPGVVRTTVGYTMGRFSNPTYEEVCSGVTGHTEAVHVVFRKAEISYEELLTVLWDPRGMDPTAKDHQGNDYGTQYRSGIYFLTNEQKAIALKSKAKIQERYSAEIATEVLPRSAARGGRHQHYLAKLGQSHEKGVCTAIRCYG
ncbi:peptide-methionine (S)-S-oxide reductase [Aureococcus anophagefferens]|nr:peptide-methionine (S)-S-oxide reductase [Aureococcus anophagefferens]